MGVRMIDRVFPGFSSGIEVVPSQFFEELLPYINTIAELKITAFSFHLLNQFEKVLSWGFGQTTPLLFIIPLVLLFDYKKTYDDSMIDVIIPLGGIALLAFVYFEGGFEVLKWFLADQFKETTSENAASSIAGIFHGIIMQ